MDKLSDNKIEFRDWYFELRKNIKSIYGHNNSTIFWMDVAERCYKRVNQINDIAKQVQGYSIYSNQQQMDEARQILDSLMTNKLVRGSTGYNIMKRAQDPITGWAELYTWYTEISGHGRNALMHELFRPTPATKDSEVMDRILKWEDDYAEALKRGVDPITDQSKVQILWDIGTSTLRDKMDDEDFGDRYLDARRFVVNWATNKRRDAENKKGSRGHSAMDVGNLED